ncbi:mechanosensitive ion channel family protein [Desulfohalovibrio reitneri]|uniref:mechanosensitive ion channel family protein n=1 Tax=Desulfohalovibrio reitneri TaxID=1307759 RepID=UPI000690675D|nr:mechanosensitive ion channel family protein [Desulfohalovibrio reitneri]
MEQAWAEFLAWLEPLKDLMIWRAGVRTLIMLAAMAVSYPLVKRLIARVIHGVVRRTRTDWDDVLADKGFFSALALFAPVAVFDAFTDVLLPQYKGEWSRIIISVYTTFVTVVLIDRFLDAALAIYQKYPVSRRRPIKGYVQLFKIFIYIMGGLSALALLLDRSPWGLLSGIGALTAVLMLVFKDTILSFVAGMQIASNDIMRVGDWVTMEEYGINGEVEEIALNIIKVRNFDKTLASLPTHKVLEGAVQNWRGMQETGGRRIMRSLLIDQSSVRFLTVEEIAKLEGIALLKPYIQKRRREIVEWNAWRGVDLSHPVNGRRMTNLGCFRAYVDAFLHDKPDIRSDLTFLVRQLQPTSKGIPLEVYVFTNTTVWAEYERIQADIFDHLLAALPHFHLRLFQDPAGADLGDLTRCLGRGGNK